MRILWLDNIGRPNADPKPHNRVCSDHFEGGCKQYNTSLPTVEKWSETSKYVYTGRHVVDSTSSEVGSALLAVDDNPVAVEASFPRATPSAVQMQSLANSLTALAADFVVTSGTTSEALPEGRETPPMSSANDLSRTSDSMMCNPDDLADSLGRSPSAFSSSSSSVATYASSPGLDPTLLDEDLPDNQDNVKPPNHPSNEIKAAGNLEVGSTSTPIYMSTSKQRCRHKSSSSSHNEHPSDGAHQESTPSGVAEDTVPVPDDLRMNEPGETASIDRQKDGGDDAVNHSGKVKYNQPISRKLKSIINPLTLL